MDSNSQPVETDITDPGSDELEQQAAAIMARLRADGGWAKTLEDIRARHPLSENKAA